jgi:hypothetical protein
MQGRNLQVGPDPAEHLRPCALSSVPFNSDGYQIGSWAI